MRALMVFVLVGGVSVGISCIDTTEGDRGVYTSPCNGAFSKALFCGRETGGAAPSSSAAGESSSGTSGRFTCADACVRLVQCGFIEPFEQNDCTAECTADSPPQAGLDCIDNSGCDFSNCEGLL